MAKDGNKVEIKDERAEAAADAERAEVRETESEISDKEEKIADSRDNESCDEKEGCCGTKEACKECSECIDDEADTKACGDEPDGGNADENTAESEDKEAEDTVKPDKKDQKITELNDKYVRLFAEFDNFRKRSEAEKSVMFAEGEKTVLLKVLPLVDNFERALAAVPEDEKASAFAEGIEKVYRAFTDQLKSLGVTEIEAVGKEFDANLHNAVMHVEDEEKGENIIIEEFQKGYMFGDKVLRYSMVKVAN